MWNSRPYRFILTAVWVVVGLAAVFPALMTPMMFDAPGATSNPITVALALSVALFPPICLVAAILPWLLRRWPAASWIFLLPVADIAVIAALVVVLSTVNGRQFSAARHP